MGEDDENGLGDFLGRAGLAGLPQRGGLNQVHVPRDQRRKRRLRMLLDVLPQQIHVRCFLHLPINVRRRQKVP